MTRGLGSNDGGHRAWLLLPVLTAVGVVQYLVLRHAFAHGRLTGLYPWDDCAIINRALWSLVKLADLGKSESWLASLRSLAPHGPLADLQTTLALLVRPGEPDFAYLFNWWAAGLALAAIVLGGRNLTTRQILILTGFVLAQTLTMDSLVVLKADAKAGLLLAAAIFLLHESVFAGDERIAFGGATLLGLSICGKLTAFYLPFCAVAILGLFEWSRYRGWPSMRTPRGAEFQNRVRGVPVNRLLRLSAVAAIPFALLFAWSATNDLIPYIRNALSPVWRDGLTMAERAAKYLPTNGEWASLPLVAGGAWSVQLWIGLTRARPDMIRALGVLVGSSVLLCAPLILTSTSAPEFNTLFIGTVLGGTLASIRTLTSLSARAQTSMALCLGAAILVFPPFLRIQDPDARRLAESAVSQLVADIVRNGHSPRPTVRLTFEDAIAGFPNYSILHYRLTGMAVDANRMDSFEQFVTELPRADYVVTLRPDSGVDDVGYELSTRFETTRALASGDSIVSSTPGLTLLSEYPWRRGRLRLFKRISADSGRLSLTPPPPSPTSMPQQ